MSIAEDVDLEPQPRRWSATEFEQMRDWGWFNGHAAALVEGVVCEANGDEPSPRLWTVVETLRMAEAGWFEGQQVHLLEGVVFAMPTQKSTHYRAVALAGEELRRAFPKGFHLRYQAPLVCDPITDTEPDLAVVPGQIRDYLSGHPATAVLAVEASDSTLHHDRKRKGSRYAKAGIPDYWILNLVDHCLEVYREPVEDKAAPYGWRYAQVTKLSAPATVSPLAAPQAVIAVADLLP